MDGEPSEVIHRTTNNPRNEEAGQLQLKEHKKATGRAVPIKGLMKNLLPHEKKLFENNQIENITHKGSSSIWLEAICLSPPKGKTTVYRPMGDIEAIYLAENGLLPETQPYQAIIEGFIGFWYANKYLTGQKFTDTHPSTIAEFCCPNELINILEKIQTKVEDGAMSMGLGNKAGGGLDLFNASLKDGTTTFRFVKIKRTIK